jgi:hypothetical protein
LTIWWQVSVKHWFKGPIHNVDQSIEDALND